MSQTGQDESEAEQEMDNGQESEGQENSQTTSMNNPPPDPSNSESAQPPNPQDDYDYLMTLSKIMSEEHGSDEHESGGPADDDQAHAKGLSRDADPILQKCAPGLAQDLARMYLEERDENRDFDPFTVLDRSCPGISLLGPPMLLKPTTPAIEVTSSLNLAAALAQQQYPNPQIESTNQEDMTSKKTRSFDSYLDSNNSGDTGSVSESSAVQLPIPQVPSQTPTTSAMIPFSESINQSRTPASTTRPFPWLSPAYLRNFGGQTSVNSLATQKAILANFVHNQQRKRRRTPSPQSDSSQRSRSFDHANDNGLREFMSLFSERPANNETDDNVSFSDLIDMDPEAFKIALQTMRDMNGNDLFIPSKKIGDEQIFFLSEMYPKQFEVSKRNQLNDIFRRKSQVPLAVYARMKKKPPIVYYGSFKSQPLPVPTKDLPLGPGRRGWPADRLPVEVFELIASHLPRESVQSMRLINFEFERKTSNRLFHTVVLPFRSEIYGMMTHKDDKTRKKKSKGKGKAIDTEPEDEPKVVHDGMKVFKAWGPHIKRFAMAFEVDESTLENAPKKGKFEHHDTWWGGYRWPHPYYNRYEVVENLEKKADEFKCMTEALSYLQHSREIGLSLDSGLGWLSGPDMSDRHRLLLQKPEVFGQKHPVPDAKRSENERAWEELSTSRLWISNSKVTEENGVTEVNVNIVRRQREGWGMEDHPLIFEGKDLQTSHDLDASDRGVYATEGLAGLWKNNSSKMRLAKAASLKPNDLSVAQQEWLLENEWAQRAFLSSFCMALTDNTQTFLHVDTLVISKLSSRYLSALERDDIWSSLPNMKKLTLMVSPDWRNILKSEAGLVHAPLIKSSVAATQFFSLLMKQVSILELTSLTIGYVGGGEHQAGIFGRNKSILPAPFRDYSNPAYALLPFKVFLFPKVKSLTLKNCWLTPDSLRYFILRHARSLTNLHLDSVSLTAHHTTDLPDTSPTFDITEGTFAEPQAAPRRGDPSTGNLFTLRPGSIPDPDRSGWVANGLRYGSWGHIIDSITPGPTTTFLRYAFAYNDHPPSPPTNTTSLQFLKFTSCGYVRLLNFKDFHQADVGSTVDTLPPYMVKRAAELYGIMMASQDMLLGQIVPSLNEEEREVFTTAFPMSLDQEAWEEAGMGKRAWECREDGQPEGGSGRFSGEIERLIVPVRS